MYKLLPVAGTIKRNWTKKDTLALIVRYRQHPELWNSKCDAFKSRMKKHIALKVLAEEFNTNDVEISRKLHNLRTQFYQELRKLQKNRRYPDERNAGTLSSKWEYFDSMKFIMDAQLSRKSKVAKTSTVSSLPASPSPLAKHEYPHNSNGIPHRPPPQNGTTLQPPIVMIKVDESESCNFPAIEEPPTSTASDSPTPPLVRPSTSRTRSRHHRNKSPESVSLEKALQKAMTPPDEFQVFGDYVASELRNLRTTAGQRKLKRLIQRSILMVLEEEDNHLNAFG